MSDPKTVIGLSRVGPGISIEFDADPIDIQVAFEAALLKEFAPFEWLIFEPVWNDGQVVGQTWNSIEIGDTARYLTTTITASGQRVDLFLHSRRLHPQPEWSEYKYSQSFCGLTGMPHFSRFKRNPKELEPYRVGIVWKVLNLDRSEVIEHVEYRKIFEAIRRQMKKLKMKPTGT
ncbi:MAG: hypothetical protein JWM11_4870 [Planctomycetaceae bacterium]|nr:hypothetical protein [Planctomycetaceae bacterium]